MWPDRRLLDLFQVEHPIVLAPMAGAMDFELAAAVAEAGGLASLPCAMLNAEQAREQIAKFRARTHKPLNVNFFCHTPPQLNNAREVRWRDALKPYYEELGIDPSAPIPTSMRKPFDAAFCDVVEETQARGRELPFRLAAGGPVQAGEGARLRDDVVRHHGRGGALARGARRRRHHRAGFRGRRPSRDVPVRRSRRAGRHLRAGAADRRRGEAAGDRGRRGERRARHRGGVHARRGRRAGRQRLSALPGVEGDGAASRRARRARRTTAPASPT